MWNKVADLLPLEHKPLIVKNNGAFMKAVFIFDEQKNPVFLHFYKNHGMVEIKNVTEWKYR